MGFGLWLRTALFAKFSNMYCVGGIYNNCCRRSVRAEPGFVSIFCVLVLQAVEAVRGSFGESLAQRRPVVTLVRER